MHESFEGSQDFGMGNFARDSSDGDDNIPYEFTSEAVDADADMLCPDDAYTAEPEEQVEPEIQDACYPSQYPYEPRVYMQPPRFAQTHFDSLDSGLPYSTGDHPDATVRDIIADEEHRTLQDYNYFNRYADVALNLNDRYEEAVGIARAAVAASFGPQAGESPLLLLAPEHFHEAIRVSGMSVGTETAGISIFGRALVKVDPETIERYGDRHIRKTISHELAHTADPEPETRYIVTVPYTTDARHFFDGIRVGNYMVELRAHVGWRRPEPGIPLTFEYDGTFLNEGIAEAHAHDVVATGDPEWAAQYAEREILLDSHGRDTVILSNGGRPLINPDTGAVAMPWHYASAAVRPGYFGDPKLSAAAMAAYSVHLLDHHSPGLQQQLEASIADLSLRSGIRARIDGLSGRSEMPIYTSLSCLNDSPKSIVHGLRLIIKALGLENEDVSTAMQ